MTPQKYLRDAIRARMWKTGERYAAARRQILANPNAAPPQPRVACHFPGNVAAVTALRILLAQAGVRAPHTGQPFSEAMLFGIAGGIGIGAFSFYYQRADFASFYLAGRHQWHDDLSYLRGALGSFGIRPRIRETGRKRTAANLLLHVLSAGRPCIAWVDMACLPHRGMPDMFLGGTYHVVPVYEADPATDTAWIGDLTDEPVAMRLSDLEIARARIRGGRFRLLAIAPPPRPAELRAMVRGGLRRCYRLLLHPSVPDAKDHARLEVLKNWADRLLASKGPERWSKIFPRGANLWRGLNFVYTFIESYGTGGGLYRSLFADFLEEAAPAAGWPELEALAGRYRGLGQAWSELAAAALPERLPPFRKARDLRDRLAELRHAGGPPREARDIWRSLAALEYEAKAEFPLSEWDCRRLLADLRARILSLYKSEVAALEAIGKLVC